MGKLIGRLAAVGTMTILLFSLAPGASSAADDLALHGTVKAGTNAVAGAQVEALDPQDGTVLASSTTSSTGRYSLSLAESPIDLRVAAPPGSESRPSVSRGIADGPDTTWNIALVLLPVRVSGQVVDHEGDPVPGMTTYDGHPMEGVRVGLGSSSQIVDEDGRFSFEVSPGSHQFHVHGQHLPGFPQNWDFGLNSLEVAADRELLVRLPKPVSLVVKAQDPDGDPISGAEVNLQGLGLWGGSFGPGLTADWGSNWPGQPKLTDAQGEARFTVFEPIMKNRGTLNPNRPGLGPTAFEYDPFEGDGTVTVTAPPTERVTGHVVDHGGNPVPGVKVSLSGNNGFNVNQMPVDGDGGFLLNPPAGRYQFSVKGENLPGFPQNWDFGVNELEVTGDRDLEVRLPKVVSLTVRAQDGGGDPVADAEVNLQGLGMWGSSFGPGLTADWASNWPGPSKQTDAQGEASFTVFEPIMKNRGTLNPNRPGLGSTEFEYEPFEGDGDVTVTVLAPSTVRVSGQVVDHEGDPVPGMTTYDGHPMEGVRVGLGSSSQVVDEDGRFSFEVPRGSHQFRVNGQHVPGLPQSWDFGLNSFEVTSDRDDVVIRLPKPVSLTVRAQGPSGDPVAGAEANLQGLGLWGGSFGPGLTADWGSNWPGPSKLTDAEGEARFTVFEPIMKNRGTLNPNRPGLGSTDFEYEPFQGDGTVLVLYMAADEEKPSVNLISPPDGAVYDAGQRVEVEYACADDQGGSGIASCEGNQPSGSELDTSVAGPGEFTVVAVDRAGNRRTVTHRYRVVVSYASVVLADEPISYWRLGDDGAMRDEVGNHLGELKNGAGSSGRPGVAGEEKTAGHFPGNGSYGYVNGIAAPTGAYSMEVWVDAADAGPASIMQHGGAGALYVTGGRYAFRQVDTDVIASVGPTPGQFDHLVGTWDGETARIYVNGELAGSAPASKAPSGSGTFYLGYGELGPWFRGYLDEAAYYPVALGADRVKAHFDAVNLAGGPADEPEAEDLQLFEEQEPETNLEEIQPGDQEEQRQSQTTEQGTSNEPGQRAAGQKCVVPRLRGLGLRAANRRLLASGCTPGKKRRRSSTRFKAGRVIRSVPRPGTTLAHRHKVKLVVSAGRR